MPMTARILIGIHVHSGVTELAATLRSVRSSMSGATQLVVLADGANEDISAYLDTRQIARSATTEFLGAPVCFNRMVGHADADQYVFLESGSILSPGWWRYIAIALAAHASHGLAGPSTNRSWNEQCVFPQSGDGEFDILGNAYVASRKFGRSWQTLEPLYSLSDFCYVVSRQVVDAVGAADEAYGNGPCWEMDYNIRAERAGFKGVWARGSYVHRLPQAPWRAEAESRLFPGARARYQDKFCGLRLRGEASSYEPTCDGDRCEHFAPPPFFPARSPVSALRIETEVRPKGLPLVSCVMVTGGRPAFLPQAIAYFHRQDYAAKELIIVDDGPVDRSSEFIGPLVRYRHLGTRESIGAKRNLGCELARGDFIAQWDDDDWYGPARLTRQLGPLLRDEADITALQAGIFFELKTWRFWTCSQELARRMFVLDVHGGTLVYRRSVWEQGIRYPDTSLAEDAGFLVRATHSGARLSSLQSADLHMYLRHGTNAWSFVCGEFIDPAEWRQIDEPFMESRDRTFYASMARGLQGSDWQEPPGSRVRAVAIS